MIIRNESIPFTPNWIELILGPEDKHKAEIMNEIINNGTTKDKEGKEFLECLNRSEGLITVCCGA